MSIEKVKAYFASLSREKEVMEFPVSSATVELAAQALSVEPARKTHGGRGIWVTKMTHLPRPLESFSSRLQAYKKNYPKTLFRNLDEVVFGTENTTFVIAVTCHAGTADDFVTCFPEGPRHFIHPFFSSYAKS